MILAVFIFISVWALTFHMLLPIGLVSHQDGEESGVPVELNLLTKAVANTVLSFIITVLLVWWFDVDLF